MKFSFLSESTPPLIGIDVSASAVKMVKLSGDKKTGFKLDAYASSSLAKDAVIDSNINDIDKVSNAIELTWKLLGIKEKNAALALPTSSVISKKVMMPAGLSDDELGAQVEAEANQYIPFPLDEINIDYQPIKPNKKDKNSTSNTDEEEVLIVAARKEKIEDRLAAAENAGLKVSVMDVDAYATEAAFMLVAKQLPNSGRNQTIMLVDIGSSKTNINVIRNYQSIYTREQNFGGNQLTQDIHRRFGLSMEESELAKRNGGLPDSYEEEVLKPYMQLIANEVSRAQQFFTTANHDNQKIDHILLAGGVAAIPDIDKMITTETQINTMIANPFKDMAFGSKIKTEQLVKDAPALLVACGLAMRGLEL